MKNLITAIILFAISIFAFFMSIRSFMEKGFLLNNAYIFASKKEQKEMNKKPYYRQSAIVFLLIGLLFLLNALTILLKTNWIVYIMAAVAIITLIYAIASSIMIEKNGE